MAFLLKIISLRQSHQFMQYCCFGTDMKMFLDYKDIDWYLNEVRTRIKQTLEYYPQPFFRGKLPNSVEHLKEAYQMRLNQIEWHFNIGITQENSCPNHWLSEISI